jgi:DNA-binding CsgD family transcriptional regulator
LLELFSSAEDEPVLAPAAEALARLVALQDGDSASPSTRALDPEYSRRHIIALLVSCLRTAAAQRPLLIVVEDLHWADETLLAFLSYLAPKVSSLPLLLLLSQRDLRGGCQRITQMDEVLPEGDVVVRLRLEPLLMGDVGTLAGEILALSDPLGETQIQALYAFSRGNPYLTEEALYALVAHGDLCSTRGVWQWKRSGVPQMPADAQEAFGWRAERLEPATREALALAAVIGPRAEAPLLATLLSDGGTAVVAAIRELVAARVLIEAPRKWVTFRHTLTQAAALGLIAREERAALHGAVAAAIERRYGQALEPHRAALVHHYMVAAEWGHALAVARAASDHASAVFAPRTAAAHLSHAVSCAATLQAPDSAFFLARGHARRWLGEFEHAREDYEIAAASARGREDRKGEWQALLALGGLWAGRDEQRSGQFYEQAHRMARLLCQPATLVASLNALGRWHLVMDRPRDARRLHQSALALARRHELRQETVDSLYGLGLATLLSGEPAQAAAYFQQCLPLVRETGDRHLLCHAMAVLAVCGSSTVTELIPSAPGGQVDEVLTARVAVELARELNWSPGEAWALLGEAAVLAPRGEHARARALAYEALSLAEAIGHAHLNIGALWLLGMLHRGLMGLAAARGYFARALERAREIGSWHWVHFITGSMATTCVMQGEFAEARALLDSVQVADGVPQSLGQLAVAVARADLLLARGEPQLALDLVERVGGFETATLPAQPNPRLARLRADALAALGRRAEAEAMLRVARQAATAASLRGAQWYLGIGLARLLHDQHREAEAARVTQSTRAIIEALAADVHSPEASEMFLQRTLAMLPPSSSPASRRALKAAYDGLTSREREVAALIAQGKSNRAIAEALVVSERTAETHVGNILNKLGFSSRAQIAAWINVKLQGIVEE